MFLRLRNTSGANLSIAGTVIPNNGTIDLPATDAKNSVAPSMFSSGRVTYVQSVAETLDTYVSSGVIAAGSLAAGSVGTSVIAANAITPGLLSTAIVNGTTLSLSGTNGLSVNLNNPNAWTAAQQFAANGMVLTGTSATTTFASLATAARTITFPDVTGNVITSSDVSTVTNAMLTNAAVSYAKLKGAKVESTTSATPSASTTIAHGLAAIPSLVLLTTRGNTNALVYESAVADATNIYVASATASVTFRALVLL